MKFLHYQCPECRKQMKIRLLHSTDTCTNCFVKIHLTPDPTTSKFFYYFNLVCSLLIGWGIGEVRISSGEFFGLDNLCADVLVYVVFFCVLRLTIFQFQKPEVVTPNQLHVVNSNDS